MATIFSRTLGNGIWDVVVSGELDIADTDQLREHGVSAIYAAASGRAAVEPGSAPHIAEVRLNTGAVDFADAALLNIVIELRRIAHRADVHLTVSAPSAPMQRLLHLAHLTGTFDIDFPGRGHR